MSHEESAGAIIWQKTHHEIKFLLIESQPYKQFKSAWAFPKGHLEGKETSNDAAKREVFEETGLKPKFDFNFSKSYTYHPTNKIEKKVTLFLAEHNQEQKLKLQTSEIRAAQWLDYNAAQKLLTKQNFDEMSFDDLIKILAAANQYLVNKLSKKEVRLAH